MKGIKFPGVYRIFNKTTGKFYIGGSVDLSRRYLEHLNALKKGEHNSIYLQRAWDKYGGEVFEFEVLIICTKEEVCLLEQKVLDEYRSYNSEIGYNMNRKIDSRLGRPMSLEARKKMSIAKKGKPSPNKGRKASLELRRKLSESHKGQQHPYKGLVNILSEEHKRKISEALKGTSAWNAGKSMDGYVNGMIGRTHSEEIRRKMSEAAKRRPSNRKGMKHTEKTKMRMSETHRMRNQKRKEEECKQLQKI